MQLDNGSPTTNHFRAALKAAHLAELNYFPSIFPLNFYDGEKWVLKDIEELP